MVACMRHATHGFPGGGRKWDEPDLFPFAVKPDQPFPKVDVQPLKRHDLLDTEPEEHR